MGLRLRAGRWDSSDRIGMGRAGIDPLAVMHSAQLSTGVKLVGVKIGLRIHFKVTQLQDGIQRIVLGFRRALRVLRGTQRRWRR